MHPRLTKYLISGLTLAALASCSSVKVIRVTGTEQPEGIPFYLPRPYVQVFEPFVIGSKAYLVSGVLSSDGKYLLITDPSTKNALDGLIQFNQEGNQPAALSTTLIRRPGTAPPAGGFPGGPQGGTGAPAAPALPASPASAPKAAASAATAASSPASTPTGSKPSGNFNMSVTNTTSLFPPTLGRRFFDVVWMPDFDEKYVVQGTPGLGNANIGMTMTQGWGLYGLDARIDNSAIVKPLLDFYSTGFEALSKLASGKIFPAGQLSSGGPQGELEAAHLPAGAKVTVKVTRVQVVAPGLYPILKPKEKHDGIDPATTDAGKRHLPLRPYTNIAFNTYEVVVVEATRPSGDTPMNLQRYFDQTATDGTTQVPSMPNPNRTHALFNATEFEVKVNALLANRKGSGEEFWKLSGLKEEGGALTGKAALTGGTNKPTGLATMVELGDFVSKQEGSKFLPSQVKLAEAK